MTSFKDSESYNYDRQNVHYRSEKEKNGRGLTYVIKPPLNL